LEYKIKLTYINEVTQARAEKTLWRWRNEVQRNLHRNAVKRLAKRTKRACLLEKGKSGSNYHFHIRANCPADRSINLKKYIQMRELR